MKKLGWRVRLGLLLIALSAILYFANYLIFGDLEHTLFYLDIELAFIPLEVLFVVLIIEWAIGEREKKNLMQKLNMVIGSFFSEVGTSVVSGISNFDPDIQKIRKNLILSDSWNKKDFLDASDIIKNFDFTLDISKNNPESIIYLQELKEFMVKKREFMLRLLENPNLLEHDTFTDLLWAIFHLSEELESRKNLSDLPEADYRHLAGDVERVYSLIINEWLQYMEHLMDKYPYMFSLSMRTNPFNPDAEVVFQK